MTPNFEGTATTAHPFPHFLVPHILAPDDADRALRWLRDDAPWSLRVESFYEQHEFSLQTVSLGPEIAGLASDAFVEAVRDAIAERFQEASHLILVDISAHRLTAGQTIRVHNDFIDDAETHRLLIQLNAGWSVERVGLLMLFTDDRPESVRRVVMPTHGSGFAFEISPNSYHAVSSIQDGERFTLVYTFRRAEIGVGDGSQP